MDPGDDTALENPQSWNKYSYSSNNPILYLDPNGKAALLFINNKTTGSTNQSFNVNSVAKGVQQKFDATGGDAKVKVGSPGLFDYAKALVKGDSIHQVTIVNTGGANELPATQATAGHGEGEGVGGDKVFPHAHADNHPSDDPSTPGNEREAELANTAAHEFGHDLGLDNNTKTPEDIMSDAPTMSGKPLGFNPEDAKKIKEATK